MMHVNAQLFVVFVFHLGGCRWWHLDGDFFGSWRDDAATMSHWIAL